MRRTVFASLAVVALVLFFAALAFPAVATCSREDASIPNWFHNDTIFFFGWLAILAGQWGWLANIPFLINVVLLILGRRTGFWSPGIQVLFLFVAVVTLLPSRGMRLPHNEAWDEPVCWLGAGFWLWVAAQALVCAAAVAGTLILPRRQKPVATPASMPQA